MIDISMRERILIKELVLKEKKFYEQMLKEPHVGSNIIENLISDYDAILEKLKLK